MILAATQTIFDDLYPFSLITDAEGKIAVVGRSLHKLCPSLKIGDTLYESFSVSRPDRTTSSAPLPDMCGEILVLESRLGEQTSFRGHIVSTDGTPQTYLVVLKPLITSPQDITRLGLTINDFEFGDPIIDFLMYMQSQVTNQQKLREIKVNLEWENRTSKLLLSIAIATEKSEAEEDIYQSALSAVCNKLEWQFGHVFIASGSSKSQLVSGNVFVNRDKELFGDFERMSRNLSVTVPEGLPGRVFQQRNVVWMSNLHLDPSFLRKDVTSPLSTLTGVGLPIFVNDEVVAVLEFFTTQKVVDSAHMRRFFDLLSIQLAGAIARQRAEHAARQHLASLAHASKMATLGELAAGVAHEINNPLHSLNLSSHLLERLSESDKLSKGALEAELSKGRASIQRMTSIIGALKSFSRDSSHDVFQSTFLHKLIKETVALSTATLHGHGVTLIAPGIPETWTAECRAPQISQVILNLLNNAFDAVVDQSDRWIRLDVKDAGDTFQISVSDSGPGIPAEVAEKIMTPFFTTKPPGKGTGLGLSISSTIMADHGGALFLDRTAPHTRFVVNLPKRHIVPSLAVEVSRDPQHLEQDVAPPTLPIRPPANDGDRAR